MNAYEFVLRMKDLASSGIQKVSQELGNATKKAGQAAAGFEKIDRKSNTVLNTWSKMKGLVVGIFAVGAITGFVSQVTEATATYQRFEAVLGNTFQSAEMGAGALNMLSDFAKNTPYQLDEVTGAYVKLANRGIIPTYGEMTKLGDLASSQGKSFDQLTEAVLDAQSGEFERLKEFGIRATKSGDMAKLSFKGVTKEVSLNATAIKDAITEYGAMKGVSGSMEVISKTIGGKISNLKDSWDGFLRKVGEGSGGIFGKFFDVANAGLNILTANLPNIIGWFGYLWDVIKPIGLALWSFVEAAFGLTTASSAMDTFGSVMNTVVQVVDYFRVGIVALLGFLQPVAPILGVIAAATLIWNLLLYANPIGIVIAAIVGLITFLGYLWTKFAAFRGSVLAVWEVLKGFGDMIKNFVINRFKELLSGITGIGQALVAFFNGDWQKAWDIGKKAGADLIGVGSAAELAKDGLAAVKSYKGGWDAGMKEVATPKKKAINKTINAINPTMAGLGLGDSGSGNSKDKKGKKDKKDGTDGIISGGSKQTNINITIGKLQDQTVIHVDSAEKGLNNLGDKVQEILLRAVNSVNQMQTT